MTYKETLNYLYSQLPMFQRIGAAAYKPDLSNTIALMDVLQHPENSFTSIHIAGTNGKGSTSHMLASILQEAGLKVGLYTSPHLKDFRERVKINGKMISQAAVVKFVENNKKSFEKIQPSFFEMTVGLAFDYFREKEVDIAVIETGLGGRLDSTNVITPLLSVITNISLDHQALLGNSIEQIAKEKAAIIKTNVPVVIGESTAETKNVFLNKAREEKAPVYFAEEELSAKNIKLINVRGHQYLQADIYNKRKIIYDDLLCGLSGLYQRKNIATVLTSVDVLKSEGIKITETQLRNGIKKVIDNTGLLGRWQILSKKPLMIADTGHNEAGIKEVLKQIKLTPHNKLHFVIGMVNDKDVSKVLSMLPKSATYYFCKANIPRALYEEELMMQASGFGLKGSSYATVKKAMKAAEDSATNKDLIFIGGSTFTVADAL